MLNTIRRALPATARDRLYTWVAALVVLLGGLGYLSESLVALWSAAAIASVTLVFALLHSTSAPRTALYAALAAYGPLAIAYDLGTSTQWAAVIGFAGTVFGLSTASTHARDL